MSFRVVTCCTHKPRQDYYFLDSFIKSLNGHNPFFLDDQFGGWGGLASKTKRLRQALKRGFIQEDILIVCDSFDFVFARPFEELVDAYKTYNKPCVISAEKSYWPEEGLKTFFDNRNFQTPFKYINSGLVVSEKSALIEILESMDLDNYPDDHRKENGQMFHSNDQYLYQNEFSKHPELIEVDYWCRLNQTLSEMTADDFIFEEGRDIMNKELGTRPCSFHANGGSKTSGIVPPILKHLNLL